MIDWEKPIETLTGWPAKVISTDYQTVSQKLHLVQIERPYPNRSGLSILGFYMEDGRPWETQHHIRNAPVKLEGWVRVINNNGLPFVCGDVVFSERASSEAACQKLGGMPAFITWEE